MKKHRQTKTGSVLVFALIVLTILLVSALAVITVAVTEKRSAFTTQKSVIAFQAADSGSERILKKIYIDNSPPLTGAGSVLLNGNMGTILNGNSNLDDLASKLGSTVTGAGCSGGIITAQNNGSPAYTFEVAFYAQGSTTPITCSDTAWRDKVVKIKSTGSFRGTSRFIEVGIRPRE